MQEAVRRKPDLIAAHEILARIYQDDNALDWALHHLREQIRHTRTAGPKAPETAEQFRDRLQRLEAAQEQLAKQVRELLNWNRGMNLIGKSTVETVWENHIADSLELLPLVQESGCPEVVDIGSGGGLPAIPLSILLPEKHFTVTDVDAKKLAFLEFVSKKLKLNMDVADLTRPYLIEKECIITARAFSEVKNILIWAERHTPAAKSFYLLKGRDETVEKELAEAKVTEFQKIYLSKGCILKLTPPSGHPSLQRREGDNSKGFNSI